MTSRDEERSALAAKLQKDLDDFVSNLKPKKFEDGWKEETFEEEMEQHPFFMSKPPEEGENLPPLLEAIQQIKYDPDSNSPEELASAYKEDGNQYFKVKKYRWAVESYTEGLKAECENVDLNAQLFANRATAHFYIGNYKKALEDCKRSKLLKPDYTKPIARGAQCCLKLKQYEDCFMWCDEGLKIELDNEMLLDLKSKCFQEKKFAERDQRKALSLSEKKRKEIELIKEAIKEREIRLVEDDFDFLNPESVHPSLPTPPQVRLNEYKSLIWPVMLLYPEYQVTDLIREFHEDTCLIDHWAEMFNDETRPTWDQETKYVPKDLKAYFGSNSEMIAVNPDETLKTILSDKRLKVYNGTPSFFITVRNSSFDDFWMKYKPKI